MSNDPAPTDLDLAGRVRLAWRYIANALDERRGDRPFFSWALADTPAYALHTHYDRPHVVGRFLDALLPAEPLVGERIATDLEATLTSQLFATIDPDTGLGWSDTGRAGVPEALIHDQRELLFALCDLIEFRDSDAARRAAAAFCRGVARLVGDADAFPGYALRHAGWATGRGLAFYYAPANSGRLVHALVRCARLTGDAVALDLARRFADDNRRRCFTPDGRLTDAAGVHIHSITGTVEGLVELGLLLGEADYIEHARQVFEVGLRPLASSFGWVKESLATATLDGEANNTGDLLRTALLLASHGYPAYYEVAERYLRNHLLASQLLDARWVAEDATLPDTDERSYRAITERAIGGFGFTTPNDWMVDLTPGKRAKRYPLNADLVQGAVQAIIAAWRQAVTVDALGVRVNLFISRQVDAATVEERMASRGELTVTLARPANLFVRRPRWAAAADISATVDGVARVVLTHGTYLFLPGLPAGARAVLRFPRRRVTVDEHVFHTLVAVDWLGDQVIGLDPPGDRLPLYGDGATVPVTPRQPPAG